MSAYEVIDTVAAAIDTEEYHFIALHYADGDVLGHSGLYSALQRAVETLDVCLHDTVEAAKAHGYEVIIIGDHGQC